MTGRLVGENTGAFAMIEPLTGSAGQPSRRAESLSVATRSDGHRGALTTRAA
jgi:hypothetical protein